MNKFLLSALAATQILSVGLTHSMQNNDKNDNAITSFIVRTYVQNKNILHDIFDGHMYKKHAGNNMILLATYIDNPTNFGPQSAKDTLAYFLKIFVGISDKTGSNEADYFTQCAFDSRMDGSNYIKCETLMSEKEYNALELKFKRQS